MNQPLPHRLFTILRQVETTPDTADTERLLVCLAEEEAVAIRYNGFSHAVMMGTPADLEDFTFGFSLTEDVIEAPSDIVDVAIRSEHDGIAIDVVLSGPCLHRYLARRRVRQLRGNTSCGLCGVEDLEHVHRPSRHLAAGSPISIDTVGLALDRMRDLQTLSRLTHGSHAAAWIAPDANVQVIREDVGRHNALDKLIGAHLRGAFDVASGYCLITSRCSFEMVQKAVAAGFSTLVSVSSPTAQAVHFAREAGLMLYASSRGGRPLLFASPHCGSGSSWQASAS